MRAGKAKLAEAEATFSPKVIAETHGVSQHTVLKWIHTGELRAIDISDPASRRRKYRVTKSALLEFHKVRQVCPEQQTKRAGTKAVKNSRDYFAEKM